MLTLRGRAVVAGDQAGPAAAAAPACVPAGLLAGLCSCLSCRGAGLLAACSPSCLILLPARLRAALLGVHPGLSLTAAAAAERALPAAGMRGEAAGEVAALVLALPVVVEGAAVLLALNAVAEVAALPTEGGSGRSGSADSASAMAHGLALLPPLLEPEAAAWIAACTRLACDASEPGSSAPSAPNEGVPDAAVPSRSAECSLAAASSRCCHSCNLPCRRCPTSSPAAAAKGKCRAAV